MDLRPYVSTDRAACLALFDSIDLAHAVRAEFEQFLDSAPATFAVAEHDGRIIGCGGCTLDTDPPSIDWCLVEPAFHRNGIGRLLAMSALRAIGSKTRSPMVRARSTENARGFFEHLGFRVASNDPSGVLEMVKKLEVCG